ncbi:DUF6292 family protein [Actinophytocola sp. NPDC049390]|uniref:DUF6292 family protein n=1 Tax=Actinophytocola sp. NPDC049390 TaxID=3363894 RepID=UPI0037A0B935
MCAKHAELPGRALAEYVSAVAGVMRMTPDAVWADSRPPATAYLPLRHRCPEFPDRDLLLVWGEQDGWLIAAETEPSDEPVVVAYLGEDVLPAPDVVHRFVADTAAGARPGQLQPPGFRTVGAHDDLADRLGAYLTAEAAVV